MTRDQRIVELYRSGLSQYQVGRIMGCHEASVKRALMRQGVPRRSYKEAMKLAYANGFKPPSTGGRLERAMTRHMTEEEIAALYDGRRYEDQPMRTDNSGARLRVRYHGDADMNRKGSAKAGSPRSAGEREIVFK